MTKARHHPRKRVIQYSRVFPFIHQRSGILGRPVKPGDDDRIWVRVLAARFRPSIASTFAPSKTKGAGDPQERAQGRPGARCTRGLVCIDAQEMRTRAYRFSGGSPAFPAQWFYDLYVLSLVIGLSCHHRPREALASQELNASVEASGPHDFAVRLGTTRQPCRP